MKKSGCDFRKPAPFGHVIETKPYSINETQKKIQEQGSVVALPKVSLSYIPHQLVQISRWHKDK